MKFPHAACGPARWQSVRHGHVPLAPLPSLECSRNSGVSFESSFNLGTFPGQISQDDGDRICLCLQRYYVHFEPAALWILEFCLSETMEVWEILTSWGCNYRYRSFGIVWWAAGLKLDLRICHSGPDVAPRHEEAELCSTEKVSNMSTRTFTASFALWLSVWQDTNQFRWKSQFLQGA